MADKFILPGSFTFDAENRTVTAAVFIGNSEWDANETLRYINAHLSNGTPEETITSFLFRIYDNSTGCLMKGDFVYPKKA